MIEEFQNSKTADEKCEKSSQRGADNNYRAAAQAREFESVSEIENKSADDAGCDQRKIDSSVIIVCFGKQTAKKHYENIRIC